MKSQACCFTGHRYLPAQEIQALSVLLEQKIRHLLDLGINHFYCGGALGFDTLSALTLLRLRQEFPQISLHLILPCQDQHEYWNPDDRETYAYILSQANEKSYISPTYTNTCMKLRNRSLVDHATHCISYMTSDYGGTAYTVNYAIACGLSIVNLADDLEEIIHTTP